MAAHTPDELRSRLAPEAERAATPVAGAGTTSAPMPEAAGDSASSLEAAGAPPSSPSPLNARSTQLGDGSCVRRVIFFDVDGTLVKSGDSNNRVHKDAFGAAIGEVLGMHGVDISEVPHHGQTDMYILQMMLEKRGVAESAIKAAMPKLTAAMEAYCAARAGQAGVAVLPGVVQLLEVLATRNDTLLGLVTGNLESICMLKLAASGLAGYFSTGGFGSDHTERGELIKIGLRRAAQLYPRMPHRESLHVVHVGDTPNDVRAAAYAGVRGVGVATGAMTVAELLAAGASCGPDFRHVVVADLTDLEALKGIFALE